MSPMAGRCLRTRPSRRSSRGTVKDMKLRYIVITSVDRDDLRDGGAGQFAECIDRSPGN